LKGLGFANDGGLLTTGVCSRWGFVNDRRLLWKGVMTKHLLHWVMVVQQLFSKVAGLRTTVVVRD